MSEQHTPHKIVLKQQKVYIKADNGKLVRITHRDLFAAIRAFGMVEEKLHPQRFGYRGKHLVMELAEQALNANTKWSQAAGWLWRGRDK